jgi:transposase InsO family protein
MGESKEISSRVRYAITQWPQDAPRGAVTAFCAEHQISRKSFYAIRARAAEEGAIAAWSPRSRRPRRSPATTPPEVIEQALAVRAELARSGLDHGPLSVMDKMTAMGLPAPSRATLARIFLRSGAVDPEPRKRPRSTFRRFVYPAPNCMWQLDGFTYPIAGGREGTVLQVIDDHSRMILASLAAPGETSEAVLAVVRAAIAEHGVPQRFLSDNGGALNPTRRKRRGQLVDYLNGLGVETITGRPRKPTTQGKTERHHRTTGQWLDARELAPDLAHLQRLLAEFEVIYNTQRPNQALDGRITPRQAWDATPKAPAPEPPPEPIPDAPDPATAQGQATRVPTSKGIITLLGTAFMLGKAYAGQTVHITWDPATIEFFDAHGESIRRTPRPAPGTRYIGNDQPRGFMARHSHRHPSPETPTVTDVPRQEPSPKS